MSEIRDDLKYNKTHEWAAVKGTEVTVGITAFAVEALNKDIVFVELPAPGTAVTQGSPFGVVEAVKAAYDLYAPATGVISAVNANLENQPELVAESPFDEGWMVKIEASDLSELDRILSPQEYHDLIQLEEH
jgi:glycine cleavage system H protein